MTELVEVPCQVCGSGRGETALRRAIESAALGRMELGLLVCRDCGFLFASPRPTRAALEAHLAAASRRAPGTDGGPAGSGAELVMRAVHLHLEHSGSLLDVGAGDGDLLCALELPRWKTVGLEPSAPAAARARARGCNVAGEPLEGNHLPPEAFDLVACLDELARAWDLRGAMQELERLVRPGGLLVLRVPDTLRQAARPTELTCLERLSHFGAGTLRRLLRDFGFRTLDLATDPHERLSVVARKEGRTALFGLQIPDDREQTHAAVARHAAQREERVDGLRADLGATAERWTREGARLVLFGTGPETCFLLDALPLRPLVAALLVARPAPDEHGLLDLPLVSPAELADLGFDVLVLPSGADDDETARLAVIAANRAGAAVVRVQESLRSAA